MTIEVVREAADRLSRERWLFQFFDKFSAGGLLALDYYGRESRLTLRARYKATSAYNRLDHGNFSRYGTERIVETDAPLPVDVMAEALQRFAESITVGKWTR